MLQCGASLTSVWVWHALFCDPKCWFKSSALLEAAKFPNLKFLNPVVARNQSYHVFLQCACTATLWFHLSVIWGPHGGTFACSQLSMLNHFSWCCCMEPRDASWMHKSLWPSLLWVSVYQNWHTEEEKSPLHCCNKLVEIFGRLAKAGMQKYFLSEYKKVVVSVLVGINN